MAAKLEAEVNVIELRYRKELVGLAERRFDSEAVGVYGASLEVVRDIFTTGAIPNFNSESMIEYQRKIVLEGRLIYYFLPFFEKIPQDKTVFKEAVLLGVQDGQVAIGDMSLGNQIKNARDYAVGKALRDCFFSLTGIKADEADIVNLAQELVPFDYHFYSSGIVYRFLHNMIPGFCEAHFEEIDLAIIQKIKGEITSQKLKLILADCLERYGVLLFFNKSIYKNTVIPGIEDGQEAIAIPRVPLTIDVLSGIEVQSETEAKLLGLRPSLSAA